VTRGDDATLEQIVKQLNKLVEVIKVVDLRDGEYVDRRIGAGQSVGRFGAARRVMQITDIFRAKDRRCAAKSLTIEVTGNESKVENFFT